MCRNIHTLHNFEPAATERRGARRRTAVRAQGQRVDEAVEGQRQAAFDEAVAEIAHVTQHLLDHLVTHAPPKDREVEAAKGARRGPRSADA